MGLLVKPGNFQEPFQKGLLFDVHVKRDLHEFAEKLTFKLDGQVCAHVLIQNLMLFTGEVEFMTFYNVSSLIHVSEKYYLQEKMSVTKLIKAEKARFCV